MITKDLFYTSHDGETKIHALLWAPEGLGDHRPRGIVQLVHGMAEYVERYEGFAKYLVEQGFVVCGNDHIGHGRSAQFPQDYGHFPMKGGADILIEDVHALRELVTCDYPSNTPYVMFGHSMGSFVVRAYIAKYDGLAAAVICGTGQQPTVVSKAGNALCHVIGKAKGERYKSTLMDGMAAGGYGKQIPDAQTPLDWLSVDRLNVDKYRSDSQCGFMFTVGGYAGVTDLTFRSADLATAKQVPTDLPLYLIAGDGDPVGGMGKGVAAAVEMYKAAGVKTVDMKLYEGYRHEILNESGCRQQVMDELNTWLCEHGI